jgi:hypothetical protein
LSSLRSRPRRYPLLAAAELTHVTSGVQMKQTVSDISAYGCHVSTQQMWPIGSRLKIRILYGDETFSASARVVYDSPMQGMGIAFTHVPDGNQAVLDTWIARLGEAMQNPHAG